MTITIPRHALPETSPTRATGTSGTAPALRLSGVTVRHADGSEPDGSPRFHTALDNASLEVSPGAFTVVLGPSGSGKSTLLSASAGLIVPDEGTVEVAGQGLAGLGDDQRAAIRREHIGIVFQQANLMASLTATEQLLLVANLSGTRGRALRALRERATELLALVGLEGLDGRRPHQLSGGQRQRVAIARALMSSPGLLLVDEPTSALDQEASARIVDLLQRITRELGPAVVMVTHDEELAARADRIVRVRDGRLLA